MSSRRGPASPTAALFAVVLSASCALPGPPYLPAPGAAERADASCPSPALALVEGQPRGLLMRLSLPPEADGCAPLARVALIRRAVPPDTPDAEAQAITYDTHLILTPDDPKTQGLWAKGALPFLDVGLDPGTRYSYALIGETLEGGRLPATPPQTMRWAPPPPPPAKVTAFAVGGHVQLTWTPPNGATTALGALVFRRDLRRGAYARVSGLIPADRDTWVDATVERGQVYVYIVSSVAYDDAAPRLGTPTAELYVEAMPDGSILTQPPPAPQAPP